MICATKLASSCGRCYNQRMNSGCYNHPDSLAQAACAACGRALCALCARQDGELTLCDDDYTDGSNNPPLNRWFPGSKWFYVTRKWPSGRPYVVYSPAIMCAMIGMMILFFIFYLARGVELASVRSVFWWPLLVCLAGTIMSIPNVMNRPEEQPQAERFVNLTILGTNIAVVVICLFLLISH